MSNRQVFEALVLPHMDAAYNLARWLLRSEQAAEDAGITYKVTELPVVRA